MMQHFSIDHISFGETNCFIASIISLYTYNHVNDITMKEDRYSIK